MVSSVRCGIDCVWIPDLCLLPYFSSFVMLCSVLGLLLWQIIFTNVGKQIEPAHEITVKPVFTVLYL